VPITSQASYKYCLRTSGGGDVRVTLVWYDYPALASAEKTLVNDLDLTVVSGGMGGQAFFGNMDLKRDAVNTVERVWLRNPPPGGLDITVSAQTLSPLTPSQNYTLVVQGAFLDTLASPHNPDKAAAGRALGGCTPEQLATVAAVQPAAAAATAAAAAAAVVPAATAAAPVPQVVEEKGPAADASANVTAAAPAQPAAAAATVPVAVQSAAAAVTPPQPAVQPAAVQPVAAAAAVAAPVQPSPADAAAAAAAAAAATATAAAPVQPSPTDAAAAAAAAATTATAAAAVPTTVATGDKASLVNALLGAMSAQPQQAAAAPAATVATVAVAATAAPQQGRRLTWAPTPSMAAWLVDPNVSVSVKVPALVCRWLNASNAGSSSSGSTARASNTVLVPVPAVLLGAVLLLVLCCALFVAGARHYSIARSISLTSAVHQESSANKRMGRAATGESALRQALLSDPSILEQLSPNKRAALGLQQRPLAPSPSGSADSFSSHATSSSGCSDAPPSAAAEAAAGLMPLAPLRVRLARDAGNSSPAALSPLMPGSPLSLAGATSAPASMPALSPAGSLRAPLQLRSASVTNSPLRRRSSGSPLPGVAEAQAAVKRMSAPAGLEVLVDDSTGGGAGAAVLAQLALGSSRSCASTPSPGSLRRASYSFTFGAPLPHMLEPEVAAAAADAAAPPQGHWGLFGLPAEQAGCSDVAQHLPGQLRSKSVKEQPVWQQQEQWQQEQQHASVAWAASPADAAVVHRDQQQ
jgi:S-DNA-T family DNA segregation ATPase FtsK/SpoIIIE